MKLSEKCKDYFVILEQNSKTKSEIEKKLIDIVQILDYFVTEINDFSYSAGDQIDVNYDYRCHGEYGTDDCSIPIEWLDLDNEEILAIIRKREEERLKKEKREAKRIEKQNKKLEEERERKEYERLKKKFER